MIGVMKMTALAKTIETLLENKKYSSLRDVLSSMNEADIAAMFSEVSSDSLPLLFRLLPKDLAADTFALMDTDEQELLIRGFRIMKSRKCLMSFTLMTRQILLRKCLQMW